MAERIGNGNPVDNGNMDAGNTNTGNIIMVQSGKYFDSTRPDTENAPSNPPTTVTDTANWVRILTVDTDDSPNVVSFDVTVTGNPVGLRLTTATNPSQPHFVLNQGADFSGALGYKKTPLSDLTSPYQAAVGVHNMRCETRGVSQIGVEALATAAGAATVSVVGFGN